MKKKENILIVVIVITIFIAGVILFIKFKEKTEYPLKDKNTLYAIQYEDNALRFERIDYSLGQNQLVIVEKSNNRGKTFKRVTDEFVTVSMESKFVFLNETLGFAIAKENLTKNNNYMGMYVTQDGGKTFSQVNINYDNPQTEILTIKKVPYYDKKVLKLPCSIYIVKEDHTGYEDVNFELISKDNGLTWQLEK